ncbi:DUF6191 domain-containing protein [Streptomyces sp. NPDC054849]
MSVMWSEAVLPGLALLLFICCGTELVLRRFFKGRTILFRRSSSARRPLTGHAFDEFNLIFNANKLVEVEQQQLQEVLRDDEGDGAPPRTRIDLDKGVASIVLPSEDGTPGPRPTADDRSEAGDGPAR